MKYLISFRPEVIEDLARGCEWYEAHVPGLSESFLSDYAQRLEFLRHSAGVPRPNFKSFRRVLFHRFPFAVWYEVEEDKVVVLLVSDCRRNPQNIKSALTSRSSPQ